MDIKILVFLLSLTISQDVKDKGEAVPLSYNYDCKFYQEAIEQSMSPFSPNFTSTKSYYSQAPEGQSLGKCNAIPCLGSPVFIIEKAHEWISQQFDIANTQSSAKLIAFKTNT